MGPPPLLTQRGVASPARAAGALGGWVLGGLCVQAEALGLRATHLDTPGQEPSQKVRLTGAWQPRCASTVLLMRTWQESARRKGRGGSLRTQASRSLPGPLPLKM